MDTKDGSNAQENPSGMWVLPFGDTYGKTHQTADTRTGVTGEPCARKPASTVRGGADGKGASN
ncbi:hypothetical protein KSB_94730 [Ktedonobacter robiniae]|uniref:Uncharacterized protein n=1 Tax=Ktedonobacter robiniae TaxID=2778365 RepID=A0ABQ3V7F5_9CHLR|nr:hypothetical protein KSB_94730 [Ktedonobacter robiniae]